MSSDVQHVVGSRGGLDETVGSSNSHVRRVVIAGIAFEVRLMEEIVVFPQRRETSGRQGKLNNQTAEFIRGTLVFFHRFRVRGEEMQIVTGTRKTSGSQRTEILQERRGERGKCRSPLTGSLSNPKQTAVTGVPVSVCQ